MPSPLIWYRYLSLIVNASFSVSPLILFLFRYPGFTQYIDILSLIDTLYLLLFIYFYLL